MNKRFSNDNKKTSVIIYSTPRSEVINLSSNVAILQGSNGTGGVVPNPIDGGDD